LPPDTILPRPSIINHHHAEKGLDSRFLHTYIEQVVFLGRTENAPGILLEDTYCYWISWSSIICTTAIDCKTRPSKAGLSSKVCGNGLGFFIDARPQ
jgi:hypothetical protein